MNWTRNTSLSLRYYVWNNNYSRTRTQLSDLLIMIGATIMLSDGLANLCPLHPSVQEKPGLCIIGVSKLRTVPANEHPTNQLGWPHHQQRGLPSNISNQHWGYYLSASPPMVALRVQNVFHSTPTYYPVWRTRQERTRGAKTTPQGSVENIHDTSQHRPWHLGNPCCKSAFLG